MTDPRLQAEIDRRAHGHSSLPAEIAITALVAAGGVILTTGVIPVLGQVGLALGLSASTVLVVRKVSRWWARHHALPLQVHKEEVTRLQHAWNLLAQDRPSIRVELFAPVSKSASLYTRHEYWGVRVVNDGAPAAFEANVHVLSAPSPLAGDLDGSHALRWERTKKRRVEILPGADDTLLIGMIEFESRGEQSIPRSLMVLRLSEPSGDQVEGLGKWELPENPLGSGSVVVALTITSTPPLPNGPERLLLRLSAEGFHHEGSSGAVFRPDT